MPFNDIEKKKIGKIVGGFCQNRVPDHLRSQIKVFYEVRGYEVKIIESRPASIRSHEWAEHPIARIKFDPGTMKWQLFWRLASGRWMKYPELEPTSRLQSLVDEIKSDPHGAFWG